MDVNEAKVKARCPDAFLSRSLRYEIWSNRAVIGFGDSRVEAWANAARRLDTALASVQVDSVTQEGARIESEEEADTKHYAIWSGWIGDITGACLNPHDSHESQQRYIVISEGEYTRFMEWTQEENRDILARQTISIHDVPAPASASPAEESAVVDSRIYAHPIYLAGLLKRIANAYFDRDWKSVERLFESEIEAMQARTVKPAESKAQTESADAEPLILIGRQMANVFYNCGQSSSTRSPNKALMRELQSQWDAALTRYRARKRGAQ